MMRETSQAAYYQHSVSGALLTQKMFILEFLRQNGPMTRQQLADAIPDIGINAVCGRIREILDEELAVETKRVKNPSGKSAYLVEAV
jgi:hypothetical protein